jgi:hypothetical protein
MPLISASEIAKHKAAQAKRPKRVTVEQAQNGGYVVEHYSDDYPNPKHAFKNHKEMLAHIVAHFEKGEKGKGKE